MITLWVQKRAKPGDTVLYGSESHQIPSDVGFVKSEKDDLLEINLSSETVFISNKTELLIKSDF